MIKDHSLAVVIANKNAPLQCVISGPADEVERCRQVLGGLRIATAAVPVSAAFHSGAVAQAETVLRQALDSIEFAVRLVTPRVHHVAARFEHGIVDEIQRGDHLCGRAPDLLRRRIDREMMHVPDEKTRS